MCRKRLQERVIMEGEDNRRYCLPDSLENWIPPKPPPPGSNPEDIFREIFDHSMIGIYRTTPDGRILLANPALVKMLGYASQEELYQRQLEKGGYEPSYPRNAFRNKIEHDGRVVGLESAWLRKDGTILYVRESARVVRDDSGEVLYYEGTVEDITESKRLAIRLAENERQLRMLVESSQDTIVLFNSDGEYIYFHGPSNLGITGQDLYGKSPEYLYGKEKGREIVARVKEVFATGETKKVEMTSSFDGKEIWTSDEYYPVRNNTGKILAVGKISHNITERRHAEISLAESEDRFKSMFVNAPLGYQSLDDNGNFLDVNNKWLEITGYSREEVIGRNFAEFLAPEYIGKFQNCFSVFQSNGEIHDVQFELIRKDGTTLSASFDGTIQLDRERKFLRTHCILQDITARKKAEESLRLSEAKWRSLVQNAPNEIIIFGLDGKIRFSNRKSPFGRKNGKLTQSLFDHFPAEYHEIIWGKMETVLDSGKSESFELHISDPNEGDRWIVYCLGAINEADTLVSFIMIGSDVTKQKSVEKSLTASEDRLTRLIEGSGDVIYVQDIDGTFTYYHGPDRYSFKAEHLVGKKPEEIFSPERAALIYEQNRAVIESRKPINVENYWEIEGIPSWFEIDIFPIYDSNGTIVALGKIARNITERKLAEEQLTASEERFRAVFETAQDAIFIKDENLVYTEVNPALLNLFQIDRANIIGKDSSELFGPDEAEHINEIGGEVLKGKIIEEEHTTEIDGQTKTLHIIRVPMKDSSGNITGMCGIARDITELTAEKKRLLQSEEKYRTLVDNLNIGISLIDRDMRVVSFNRKLAEMYPALNGNKLKKCYEIYYDPPRDKICDNCPTIKAFSDGNTHEYVSQIKHTGQTRSVRSVSTPVLDQHGNVISIIEMVEDITDRLRLQEELAKSDKLDSIGVLAGGIAHDFNNIMTAIMANISLALTDLDPDSEVSRLISEAERATSRAQGLTRQLLTFSKGGQPIRRLAHLGQLLRDSARFALVGSNVKCDFSIPSDLYPAEIDEGQIGQVIHNIVINAVQAMPDGGNINLSARNLALNQGNAVSLEPGQYIMFSIEDCGTGIPENHLKKIFDPFYTTKQKGSGLGLATSYSIVNNHRGCINVDSKIGRGTRFDIYLPANVTTEPKTMNTEEIPPAKPSVASRILVVDDEAGIRRVARVTLERLGYEVTEAEDGGAAEQTYRRAFEEKRAFDAVILDLTIPGGLGGKKTIENLKRFDPGVKAIVSSGYSNDPVMAEYRRYGFRGRVAKPYRASELGRVVAETLSEESKTDEN